MEPEIIQLSETFPSWLWNLLLVVVSMLSGFLVKYLLIPLVRKSATNPDSYSVFRSFVRRFNKVLRVFIPLVVFNSLLPLTQFSPSTYMLLSKAMEVVLIGCIALILIKGINVLEDYLYHRFDIQKANNLKERKIRTQIVFLRKLAVSNIVVFAIAIILLSFESLRKVGAGLLTSVGIGGIIIGFAAQKSLGNLLAGFQIAFTQPIRIDDVLIVEGEWGKVEEINLTYVVVNIWDKRRLVLPIQYFIETPFQNWTRTTAEILGTVFIYTDFTVPVDKLREKLSELLKAHPLWDGQVDVMQVTDLKEQTMEIRCLMSCRNAGEAFNLRCYIREAMIGFIRAHYPESLTRTRVSFEDKTTDKPKS